MSKQYRVKPFHNGGSQAIRIPAEFRFSGEVLITKNLETGAIELREVNKRPLDHFLALVKVHPLQEADFQMPERERWAERDLFEKTESEK